MSDDETNEVADFSVPPETSVIEPSAESSKTDPLASANYEMEEDEKSFRARPEEHRRLNRRHLPPITPERIEEVRLRLKEVDELRERRSSVRAKLVAAQEDKDVDKESVLSKELEDLDAIIARRSPGPLNEIQFRLAERYGLMDENDLKRLRMADERRTRKADKLRQRALLGEFRASLRAAERNTPVAVPEAAGAVE